MKRSIKKLDSIFKPRSVAVIGATMRTGSLGRTVMKNLVEYEFNGKIFPVNPKHDVIHSIKCFSTVTAIPDDVDLGIIIVPRDYVLQTVTECGKKGLGGVVVLTAGFREVNEAGRLLEDKILEVVKKYGMRMVGPNCMGVINTHPDVRLDGTFAPDFPKRGNIGFLSQSGALGVAIISSTKQLNLGMSMFISVGNKADLSGNELLEYWEDDPDVEVILLYLESFGDPRKFTQIAKRVSKKKPIIAVKAGRTLAGARAASSHTGAIAGADIAVDAIMEQCGIIRASSIQEMFELAVAFSRRKYPKGNRIGIITNGGGPAIMAADACSEVGLEIPTLSKVTQRKIKKYLPPEASATNPVDLIAGGGPNEFEKILSIVIKDEDIDAALAIAVSPPTLIDPKAVTDRIATVARKSEKPILTVFMGKDEEHTQNLKREMTDQATYQFPEPPVKALAAMLKFQQWLDKPEGLPKKFRVNKAKVSKILKNAENKKAHYLSDKKVFEILSAYNFPVMETYTAKSHNKAAELSKKLGYPVVLKAVAKDLVHKTDIGGVKVDLRNRGEVVDAFYKIKEAVESAQKGSFKGVIVQKMVRSGTEVILGMTSIEQFGPLIMFGLGGIFVETIKDVQVRPAPITDLEAEEMIHSIKGYPILTGLRGEKGVDTGIIKDCLLRLSQLVIDFECIQAIDINPFIVGSKANKSFIVDARILAGR